MVQEAVLYGFKWNLKKKTVGIPDNKLKQLKKLINNTLKAKIITGRALETLCGKIMHWSQLYKPAKALCYNMVSYLHKILRCKQNYKYLAFRVPPCILRDLRFWLKYTSLIKEVSMDSIINEPSEVIVGASDACDDGAGFCVGQKWAYYKFEGEQKEWHINQKEAHAVITLLHNMKDELRGKKLILLVDNTALFYSMAKHWGSERMMPCIYEMCLLMMQNNIRVWFEWIPTKCNVLADALSRYDFKMFWDWVNIHRMTISPKPITLSYYHKLILNSN